MDLDGLAKKHQTLYNQYCEKMDSIERFATKAYDSLIFVTESYKKHWADKCPLEIKKETTPYKQITLNFAEYRMIFDFAWDKVEKMPTPSLVLRYVLIGKNETKADYHHFAVCNETNGQWHIITADALIEWEKEFDQSIELLLNKFVNKAINEMYKNYVP